jgi:hypothetical protein
MPVDLATEILSRLNTSARPVVAFVTERLGWSETSADRFLAVGKMFAGTPNLGAEGLTIDASSLYLIAAPSAAEVREQVLEKAATPEGIARRDRLLIEHDADQRAAPLTTKSASRPSQAEQRSRPAQSMTATSAPYRAT